MNQLELLFNINLAKLTKELYLSGKGLTSLPESLGQLTSLQTLNLYNNQLTSLPEWLGQLTSLQTLKLSYTGLTSLPNSLMELAEWGTLKELYLHGNEALGIPPEVLGATSNEVQFSQKEPADPGGILRYYFARQRAGKGRPLNEAKVLFIGEANVGKSSLIAALKLGPGERHFDKTRGLFGRCGSRKGKQRVPYG